MAGPAGQFVLVDYDVDARAPGQVWERAALIASGILTAAVLAMVVVLYRRLQFASREAEDQRRLAQLGEAARTLAHEIKNPLTAAQMQTALLRRAIEQSEHRRIDVIDEELKRIRVLTDQVREFLRSGVGNPERLRVLPLVQDLADRLSIPVELHGDDSITVWFDRERFQSVMGNLLRNAREADETGEPIRVEI
jgi:signal transduction histidine kinase